MMNRKPFIETPRDDHRSELLRRLAVALEPKPIPKEQRSLDKRTETKSTDQE